MELPDNLRTVYTPRDLLEHLTHLEKLIVYQYGGDRAFARSTKPTISPSARNLEEAKEGLSTWISRFLQPCPCPNLSDLTCFVHGPGRTYTFHYQQFLGIDQVSEHGASSDSAPTLTLAYQVCIATLFPGAEKFTYEFKSSDKALLTLEEENDWFLTPDGDRRMLSDDEQANW